MPTIRRTGIIYECKLFDVTFNIIIKLKFVELNHHGRVNQIIKNTYYTIDKTIFKSLLALSWTLVNEKNILLLEKYLRVTSKTLF